jgi:hypothetical protein
MDADFVPSTPMSLLELNLDALIGLPTEIAAQQVVAAGGQLRAIEPGQPVTLDYRGNRVTAVVVDGRISTVHGIG